jgi:hypothetical protein
MRLHAFHMRIASVPQPAKQVRHFTAASVAEAASLPTWSGGYCEGQ